MTFIVFAMPRSRSYWLSRFLSYEGWHCGHEEALRWALGRGSRSGRVAWQFARDWAGRTATTKPARPASARKPRT